MHINTPTMLSVARCFLEDGDVTDEPAPIDWQRLGRYVVARRVQLGHGSRRSLSDATGISLRVLADLEAGKRSNYDAVTLARLEQTLGWLTGSVARITAGGEPVLTPEPVPPAPTTAPPGGTVTPSADDDALIRVMTSGLSDDKKRALIGLLIEERQSALRRAEAAARILNTD